MTFRWLMAAALVAAAATPVAAQSERAVDDRFRGSVPQGTATAEPLALSFKDTLDRALQFNLGLLLQEESRRAAHGSRWEAMADLLPNLRGSVSERRQVINLEAFGFPAPDPIVGPFNVFDARIGLSQRLIDLSALNTARAASYDEKVQALGVRSARELVVLVTVNLYLESISASSRIDVARAQLETAEVLHRQAANLKASGIVAGIDVLRAEAQVQRQRQRLIVSENEFEKAKLRLGRAIGLPPGQPIRLTDTIPFAPLDAVPLDKAIEDAYAHRADYLAATDRVAAAEARARARSAERLPSLTVDAVIPVSLFFKVTVAPGTAAPDASTIVPRTVALSNCARATRATSRHASAHIHTRRALCCRNIPLPPVDRMACIAGRLRARRRCSVSGFRPPYRAGMTARRRDSGARNQNREIKSPNALAAK